MKKIFVLILIVVCLTNCKSTIQQPLQVKAIKSDYDITFFYSKKMETITVISLPSEIIIENPTSIEKSFSDYSYIYGNTRKGNFMSLYLIEKEKLIRQSVSRRKFINARSSKKYLILSKHFVDTTKFGKQFFKPYIEEMIRLNQDTLNVGAISEFRKKHSELIKSLTNNDSIMIQPMKPKSGFEKEIKIPIN